MIESRIIQLVSVTEGGDQGSPSAFYGLDAEGHVWFGSWDEEHGDGGAAVILWRPVKGQQLANY